MVCDVAWLLLGTHVKKIKFTLEQAVKAQRGSRGIAVRFLFNLHIVWGWVVSAMPRPLYPRESGAYVNFQNNGH
jgi:hypothetical protein